MKHIFLPLFLLFSLTSLAEESNCDILLAQHTSREELAQRGCCSHHGGVCGCTGGRAVCCDGALSPSCSCHADGGISMFTEENEKNNS